MRRGIAIALVALLPLLGGCMTVVRHQVSSSIAQARHELHVQPLTMRAEGHPNALIGLDGSLRIGVEPVALAPAQREALLAYRQVVVRVADAGLASGDEMTREATRGMWTAMFSGDDEAFEQRVEARTATMERELCAGVADIRRAELHLIELLPRFRPYAQQLDDAAGECRVKAG